MRMFLVIKPLVLSQTACDTINYPSKKLYTWYGAAIFDMSVGFLRSIDCEKPLGGANLGLKMRQDSLAWGRCINRSKKRAVRDAISVTVTRKYTPLLF